MAIGSTQKTRGFEIVDDKFRNNPTRDIIIPARSTRFSAGYDFCSPISFAIPARGTFKLFTDVKVYMLEDEYLSVYIRSSVATKKKLLLVNGTGIIDCVPKGTKISTNQGFKKVEDLFNSNEKEMILSYNEKKECIEDDVLEDIWIVDDLDLLEIRTEKNDVIKIPLEKEVFTKRGWVKAKNLKETDKILRVDN
jgi:dUTPase